MILQYIMQLLCTTFERNKLKDMIVFLIQEYPKDLSTFRIANLCYLADWHYAINHKQQISNVKYKISNHLYWIYLGEIMQTIRNESKDFYVHKGFLHKNKKTLKYIPKLTNEEKKSLMHVINKTKDLNKNDFDRLISSTYPIFYSEKGAKLDLIAMAQEYKSLGQK